MQFSSLNEMVYYDIGIFCGLPEEHFLKETLQIPGRVGGGDYSPPTQCEVYLTG